MAKLCVHVNKYTHTYHNLHFESSYRLWFPKSPADLNLSFWGCPTPHQRSESVFLAPHCLRSVLRASYAQATSCCIRHHIRSKILNLCIELHTLSQFISQECLHP